MPSEVFKKNYKYLDKIIIIHYVVFHIKKNIYTLLKIMSQRALLPKMQFKYISVSIQLTFYSKCFLSFSFGSCNNVVHDSKQLKLRFEYVAFSILKQIIFALNIIPWI